MIVMTMTAHLQYQPIQSDKVKFKVIACMNRPTDGNQFVLTR